MGVINPIPRQARGFQGWIQQQQIDLLAGNLLAVAVFFVFTPVIAFVASEDVDYGLHTNFIVHALTGQSIDAFLATVPHFLFHATVVLAYRVLAGISLPGAVFIVTLGYYIAGALALYWLLGRLAGRAETYRRGLLYAALALILILVAPVNLLTPDNRYMGYIPTSAYHNPTIVALKPFALVLFGLVMGMFKITPSTSFLVYGEGEQSLTPDRFPLERVERREKRQSLWYGLLCATVTVLSILAKPNYVMAFLPALVLGMGWAWWREWPVRWGVIIGGVIVPAAAVLGAQALLFGATGGIIFSPLAVIYEWDRIINPASSDALILKFVLSALFPLCVYLCFWKWARQTFYLNVAWAVFGIGAAYGYLLAEGGSRLGAGNFTWSGQITLLVLFAASAAFMVDKRQRLLSNKRLFVCTAALGLHLVSGIAWYGYHTGWAWMGYLIERVW